MLGMIMSVLRTEIPGVLTGITDIDISVGAYTDYTEILSIVPQSDLKNLVIDLDLDKETTGVNDVANAADTCQLLLQISVDGTLYTGMEASASYTLTGTFGSIVGGISGKRFNVGQLSSTSKVKVFIKLSAERADAEIPYKITYVGRLAPTVTAVAAL